MLLLFVHSPVQCESIFRKAKKLQMYSDKDTSLSWGNEGIKDYEQVLLNSVKEIIRKHIQLKKLKKSDWLCNAIDVDILRFLRLSLKSNKNNDDAVLSTFNDLLLHSKWRQSRYGIDNINKHDFEKMVYLNNYINWLGQDIYGYPTLYVKSRLHDGKYYNEDPKLFTGYIVWILENGRKQYGHKKINVILDRSPVCSSDNFKNEKESADNMNVMTSLIELYKRLYAEIHPNYPDLLNEFKIFHTSWVFNICLALVMKIFDHNTGSKFKIYKNEKEIRSLMKDIFPNYVPPSFMSNNDNIMKSDDSYSEMYYTFH